ncbi:MAG TPA: hypothetical protein VH277_13480 [Gemmatimonadaceae bacterium]|jgi:hypothetical protein|nr:hypothetical protein [Gemmatimonadaceae bacterium]
MARQDAAVSDARSVESIADSADLRSVMTAALAARPVDESSLRRGVWTYVGGERDAGASPGHVIMALTGLIEEANLTPHEQRLAVTRRVILWCVEAYFGHLGGDVVGTSERALSDTGTVRVR